jgi:hypothetical protein
MGIIPPGHKSTQFARMIRPGSKPHWALEAPTRPDARLRRHPRSPRVILTSAELNYLLCPVRGRPLAHGGSPRLSGKGDNGRLTRSLSVITSGRAPALNAAAISSSVASSAIIARTNTSNDAFGEAHSMREIAAWDAPTQRARSACLIRSRPRANRSARAQEYWISTSRRRYARPRW